MRFIIARMDTIGNALSRKSVAALSAAILAAFFVFAFPRMGAEMAAITPAGGEYDTALFYSPAQAALKASLYDGPQRAALASLHWTYDLAFPLSYGFFSLAMWALGLRLLAGSARPRYVLLLIPLAAPLFDILENASVTALLRVASSGAAFRIAAAASSVCTVAKWLLVAVALLGALGLLAAGLIASAVRRA
jgi:hypothetical protein